MMVLSYAQSKDLKTLADRLVAYSDLSRQEAENLASSAGPGPYTPLPLLNPSAILADLPEETQRTFEYRALILKRFLNSAYPLASDEELLEDGLLFTCLSEDWMECRSGTIAVRRKTNLGEIIFLNREFTFDLDGKEIISNSPDYSPGALAVAKAEEFAMDWATLGLDIAKSLLGSLAGLIGSSIFQKFFPPGTPPYFQLVYDQFRQIVRQEIEESIIRLLVGDVAAVQSHMRSYAIHREGGNRDAAEENIRLAYSNSVQVTRRLLQFPTPGLGPFLTAGGLHLAILQERALRDPNVTDPNDSTYAQDYRETSLEFASFASEQADRIASNRAANIIPVTYQERTRNTPYGPIDDSFWWWADRVLGIVREYPKRGGCRNSDPEGRARRERTAHYDSVINSLTQRLKPAKEIADNWRMGGKQPLPLPEKPIPLPNS